MNSINDRRLEITHQNKANHILHEKAASFMKATVESGYSYCFDWANRPIIQYPQDIVAFQEIAMRVVPDVIVETGIAHGGSLTLSASILTLLDVMQGLDPRKSPRKVVGWILIFVHTIEKLLMIIH